MAPGKCPENLGGEGYRLPTEAEWEFACRAGTATRYSFGNVLKRDQAQIDSDKPTVVGSFPANAFGLYDMHGNIAEWCVDGYDLAYYEDCPIDDPRKTPNLRHVVQRGGQFCNEADLARSAARGDEFPWAPQMYVGIRVARDYREANDNSSSR